MAKYIILILMLLQCLDSLKIGSSFAERGTRLQLRASSVTASDDLKDLTKDGGVKKIVLGPGSGKKVETGDILAIEFTASLKDGMIFAKGDKEKCIVKDGSLIKGWDIGISSMKIGERAKFVISPAYAYGAAGISPVIPPNADIELEIRTQAWLGNQLRPETLFQKDLDIDPFVSSTPEAIQADYDAMQANKVSKSKSTSGIVELYLTRLKNISFGFGGSGFFTSQSGEKAPWWLNPNITFPTMITICMAAFLAVITTGSVKEKGIRPIDLDISSISQLHSSHNYFS